MKKVSESVTGHRKYTYLLPFLLQNRSAVIGHSSQVLGAYRDITLEDFFNVHSCYLLLMYVFVNCILGSYL